MFLFFFFKAQIYRDPADRKELYCASIVQRSSQYFIHPRRSVKGDGRRYVTHTPLLLFHSLTFLRSIKRSNVFWGFFLSLFF